MWAIKHKFLEFFPVAKKIQNDPFCVVQAVHRFVISKHKKNNSTDFEKQNGVLLKDDAEIKKIIMTNFV